MFELLAAEKRRPGASAATATVGRGPHATTFGDRWFTVARMSPDVFEVTMKRPGLSEQRLYVRSAAHAAEAWQFAAAWERCWNRMVTEKAWPHATTERRSWRSAMVTARPEYLACWLGVETGFSRYVEALAAAIAGATDESRFAGEQAGARLVA